MRRLLIAVTAGLAVAAGLAAWALWPRATPAQARQYLDVSACLLTGAHGIATDASSVWASLEAASQATHVMVSYLPDGGGADEPAMINTLVQRRCGLIVTADTAPAPVIAAARANPREQFLIVTALSVITAGTSPPANLTTVPAADAPAQISQALRSLAAA